MAQELCQLSHVSIKRACRVVDLPRSMYYYKPTRDYSQLIDKLNELAELLPHRGIDEYYGRLKQQGYPWNRKRVLRVYRLLNLQMRRKSKSRVPTRVKEPLEQPSMINHTWSMDFMHDVLENGRKVRILNIIDDFNREALAVEAAYSHNSLSVIKQLEIIMVTRDKPMRIRVDNGPEFISTKLKEWCDKRSITLSYIQPGKPMQNAYIERFNRLYREDILDAYIFETKEQLRVLSRKWQDDYNENHPHKSLGGKSPRQFAINSGKLSEFTTINSENMIINN